MKFCIRCGQPLSDDAAFCSRCGFMQVYAAGMPQPQIMPQPQTIPQPQVAMQPQIVSQPQPDVSPETEPAPPQELSPETETAPPQAEMPVPQPVYSSVPQPVQPIYAGPRPAAAPSPKSVLRSTSYFVWSMILIFIINPIGTPLAIVGAVFSSEAHASADLETAREKLHITKVICIAVTCVDALCLIVLVLFAIYYFLRSSGGLGLAASGGSLQS
ncbi:MAG: zinc-ribbon domain-containing protein [Clostridia bacterium]|nr:zinc-ribbon domain-containing protein [Clostridia bacterium]